MPSTKAKSLTERTGEALYDMILIQKQFKPGDKLPNEFELSARLGVSRATLREAVSALIAQGVLVVKRGSGIKDYGRIFPGHGGVLDRFDSVIFVAPAIELLIHAFILVG